ncbi:MAG: hypothetical protein EBZ77_15840 [Chitinophagia bacterium]|nr:hypothetical protein [Chitinophagia bacterium]
MTNFAAVTLNTKGGTPTDALLKEFKTYRKQPLVLFNGKGSHLDAVLPYDNGRAISTLYFTPTLKKDDKGGQTLDMMADLGAGKKVDLIYTLPAGEYMMHLDVVLTGMGSGDLKLNWQTEALHTEKDIANERQATQVYYQFTDNDNDFFTVKEGEEKTYQNKTPVTWVGFRKQYFTTVLAADGGFAKVDIKAKANKDDSNVVAINHTDAVLTMKGGAGVATASLKWYIGPNDYNTLKSYKMGMENMIPLGSGLMSFVKYINAFFLIPLFYLLSKYVTNYALIIVILTIFIRLLLSFFTYKSYLSSAKMRVLKPELDQLKEKIGDDQQKFSVEQMKLYREAGVNPLGGCLSLRSKPLGRIGSGRSLTHTRTPEESDLTRWQ